MKKQLSTKSIKVRPWTYHQLTSLQHEYKADTFDEVICKLLPKDKFIHKTEDANQNASTSSKSI